MKKVFKILASAAVFSALFLNTAVALEISANDKATGWASYSGTKDLAGNDVVPPGADGTNGGEGADVVLTVSTRQELLAALKTGERRIIYVKGIIDMTDTGRGSLLPETVNGSNERLDKLIAQKTAGSVLPVKSFKEWKEKYTASFNYDEDQSGKVAELRNELNNYWRELVFLRIQPNTTLIGLDENSGIVGGSLSIKNVSNVIVRNLSFTNCYNPFPKVEEKDGLNADFDCIAIQGSKYVWIDHCTMASKFSHKEIESDKYLTKDGTSVKWQVYDGLCDMTNTNDFVTISWCKFYNHDKTMLIGNSDKKAADKLHQTITLHHNWYDKCTQRLPMVRYATIHIMNNLYTNTESRGIDRRFDCRIYSEANSFADKARSVTTNTFGSMFDVGSKNIRTDGMSEKAEWIPSDYYSYTADKADDVEALVKAGAGSGKVTVKR